MNLRLTYEPSEKFGAAPDQRAALRQISSEQLRLLGVCQIAYLKRGTGNSLSVFVLYWADGTTLMVGETLDTALDAAVELGLDIVPVH